MTPSQDHDTTTHSVLEAAIQAIRRGEAVIPVPRGEKGPKLTGWQKLIITEAEAPRYFREPCNIGVLLGEPSRGLVDVDLDAPEAILIADRFLPATHRRHGRPGKRNSHPFYRTSRPGKTMQYQDLTGDNRMIVELRSTGGQTMIPPSIHPSGELLAWEEDGDPAEVDWAVLQQAVQHLAAAVLLARHWPGTGGRHNAALALAGLLLRNGWRVEDAAHFVEAVAFAAHDEEIEDRVRSVYHTAETHGAGEPVTAGPRLTDLIDEKIVRRACNWLGIRLNGRKTTGTATQPEERRSQATELVRLAEEAGVALFHSPEQAPYAGIPRDGHMEIHPIKSATLKQWLRLHYYERFGAAANAQAVQDAVAQLEARALFQGPREAVAVRVAYRDGRIYVDLGNDAWEFIEVSATGISVLPVSPVRFVRAAGMVALPHPELGGAVEELRPFVNVRSDEDFRLLVTWLITVVRGKGPFPALILVGGQGTAKSTTGRILSRLIDPATSPLRGLPKDERDLFISAQHRLLLTYDNLSFLSHAMSDALCRLATGGGFSTRALCTDTDEIILEAVRPVVITSIAEVVDREDLLDRAILLHLPEIPEGQHRSEEAFWSDFEAAAPRLLGALLSVASLALGQGEPEQPHHLPRMADFAAWGVRTAAAIGWTPEAFLAAFAANRRESKDVALEASPVAQAILTMMQNRVSWRGTATRLLTELSEIAGEHLRRSRTWPKAANALTNQLRGLKGALRTEGITVELDRREGTKGTRIVEICAPPAEASDPTPAPDWAPPDTVDYEHLSWEMEDETDTITDEPDGAIADDADSP
ncbi:MAG: bifunctional DNA primase/polymerase [Dehalococcoidia bacterium]